MQSLAGLFRPIIAKPQNTENYVEIPPCEVLRPYVCCYWGSPRPLKWAPNDACRQAATLIIPDLAMDIIFEADYRSHRFETTFCGIQDKPFTAYGPSEPALLSTFGIRFYFWAMPLFADIDMRQTLNAIVDVRDVIGDFKRNLEGLLIETTAIADRVAAVEKYLIRRLLAARRTISPDLLNAVQYILQVKGQTQVGDISAVAAISLRHLQRLFPLYFGLGPKKAAELVRFQCAWQDLYYSRRPDYSDVAYRHGYCDQAHFNHVFKQFAGRTPSEALMYARG